MTNVIFKENDKTLEGKINNAELGGGAWVIVLAGASTVIALQVDNPNSIHGRA